MLNKYQSFHIAVLITLFFYSFIFAKKPTVIMVESPAPPEIATNHNPQKATLVFVNFRKGPAINWFVDTSLVAQTIGVASYTKVEVDTGLCAINVQPHNFKEIYRSYRMHLLEGKIYVIEMVATPMVYGFGTMTQKEFQDFLSEQSPKYLTMQRDHIAEVKVPSRESFGKTKWSLIKINAESNAFETYQGF